MTPLQEKLEAASATFEALVTPPLTVLEIFESVKAVGECVKEIVPAATEEEYTVLLLEGWEWADGKYELVEKADEAIKFPIWLAPAEAFDGPGVRYLAERVLIPALAKKLAATIH